MSKKSYCYKVLVLVVILAFGAAACGKSGKTVRVASKPHSEQYILAEMIALLIEKHTSIKVEKKLGIGGGTSNIHPAMLKGEIDIYPEYSGTGWLFVLKEKKILPPGELFKKVADEYKKRYGIQWLGIYGFNNTFTLAMKKKLAADRGIKSYSDLSQKGKDFRFGAEYDFFEREDGYQGLQRVYGIAFRKKTDLDIGLKYEALASGKVDVINAFSTDGLLKKYDLTILEDDKNFFPAYQAATLIRMETLKKYPELLPILKKLEGAITNEDMIAMNYAVESEKKDPVKVAMNFLTKKGLL